MTSDEFDQLQELSLALAGNRVLLPVAVAIADRGETSPVSTPIVNQLLAGRVPSNRIGKELARLHRLGALSELPYPGRPHPRIFDVVSGPFWIFVRDWALDPDVHLVDG